MLDQKKINSAALLICIWISAALLYLCSMSSPLYPLNIWDDANCLLTVGRVMKEGGVLYRDIYEQKGPLLYLIHMIAACISDSSFLGVYVMEAIAFAATLFAAYRAIRLYAGAGLSLGMAALFGACVLVSRSFLRGDSAEEFCLPFLMAAMTMVLSHHHQAETPLSLRKMALCGVLAGCVAMIKFTALALFAGLCLCEGLLALRRSGFAALLQMAGAFLAGMMLPILPWIVYFAAHDALYDAYLAYIHNNVFLYGETQLTLFQKLEQAVAAGAENVSWSVMAVAAVLLSWCKRGFLRIVLTVMAVCSFAVVFMAGVYFPYYPLVLCVFAVPGFGLLAQAIGKRRHAPLAGLMCAVLAFAIAWFGSPNAFLRGVALQDTAQGRLAAQIEDGATLLQYSHLDDGMYLLSGALPQEKYFVRLNVAYEEMIHALDQALLEGRPEYVLISWRELPAQFERYELIAYDTAYDDQNRLNRDLYLYRRKTL